MEQPQIRDITPIPFFAWSPGLLIWCALLGLAVIFILARLVLPRYLGRPQASRLRAFEMLRDELIALELRVHHSPNDSSLILEQGSSLIRRFLSTIEGIEVPTLSRQELLARYLASPFSVLVSTLLTLEELKYSRSNVERSEQIQSSFQSIRRELERLHEESLRVQTQPSAISTEPTP